METMTTPTTERVMTIARGLARKKTIKAQLNKINSDIQKYAAWNNKKKHPLGDNKAGVEKTLEQAQQEVLSLYQQYNDLSEEYKKICLAIDRTNMVTDITIADKTMKVAEAIVIKRDIAGFMRSFSSSYGYAISNAERDVERHNAPILSNTNYDENTKNVLRADVSYFVPKEKVKETDDFLTIFVNEIDGELNAINATTPLIWE